MYGDSDDFDLGYELANTKILLVALVGISVGMAAEFGWMKAAGGLLALGVVTAWLEEIGLVTDFIGWLDMVEDD